MSNVHLLSALGLFAMAAMMQGAARGAVASIKPVGLKCEYRADPSGIGVRNPRLQWKLDSDQPLLRNQRQGAYQILVSSSEANLPKDWGDLWDSGKVSSDRTYQIAYAGTPLVSGQQAFWKVRAWDADGNASNWSETARFSMGLLEPADFSAKWIGYDAPVPETAEAEKQASTETLNFEGLQWMWSDDGAAGPVPGTRYFRKVITIPPGKPSTVRGVITADSGFEFFVNGKPAGAGTDVKKPQSVAFGELLKEGRNVLGIIVHHDAPTPAGVIGRFRYKIEGTPPQGIDIDTGWEVSSTEQPGWNTEPQPADASAWHAAKVVAAYGDDPWGRPPVRLLILPPPPYLRKVVSLDKPIVRATAYASALGVYELHINGLRVGRDHLTPGWTDYAKRVYYQTYDVTELLVSSDNVIGAILGDGWYSSYWAMGGTRELYGKAPRIMVQINIEFADGTTQQIITDDTWKASYGPLREADMLMGTTYDANQQIPGWDAAGFDDSQWQAVAVTDRIDARVQASPNTPIRTINEIPAKSITELKRGTYVIDLGQNMVGWVRLKLADTRPGQRITLRHAEMINADGTLYTVALRSARATDTYISRGGAVAWEPKFTFHGFRYVEISGLTAAPPLDAITGVAVHSELERAGSFDCSSELVNQLYHNIIWGQKGNYLDVPTDCPQRDERLGWTGDAQFFIRTGAYNFDVSAFFTKWLVDLNQDSADADGAFACVAPDVLHRNHGATGWADAGIICPYTIWQYYGDTRIIEQHYDSMAKYIDYLQKTSDNLVRGQGTYGDWLNLGGGAKSEVIGTAYSEHVTRLMSEMAAAIGRADDAKKYRELADRIRQTFIARFVKPDGTILDSSQTGYALAFAFNLLPPELREKSADAFVEEIHKHDWHLATGFIGTPVLLPALSRAGREDVAYRLLLTESFPSWLYQVKLGATTMWERWDGWSPETGPQTPEMNSFNHYAFGSVGEWLYRTVGGIDTDGPGFDKIIIHPRPNPNLSFAKTSYESIHGTIACQWRAENQGLTISVTIPPNTTATIHIPTKDPASVREGGQPVGNVKDVELLRTEPGASIFRVGSGTYSFTATW